MPKKAREPPMWATPEMLAEKVQEFEMLMEEVRAFLAEAKSEHL